MEADTREFTPERRFACRLETVSHSVAPVEARSDHAADFLATMRVVDLGLVRVAMHRYPAVEIHRTSKLIRRP
ncbi:MAG TPA: hypothetical protein VF069_14310 [Streptosporangiaceae bacterium]